VSFALGQLRVAHGNLSCRKGRMLPHTGLFLLGKVALQMRIRRRLKASDGIVSGGGGFLPGAADFGPLFSIITETERSGFPPARE
ncbi:hypothetical protein, partial [Neisseria meningitidis]|uniref:hypothetical protein n=1 Tax=Neisseria meningitidis TaxID=487 RepID=UPI001C830802